MRLVLVSSVFWFGLFVAGHWACFAYSGISNRGSFLTKLFAASLVCQELTVVGLASSRVLDLRIVHWAGAGALTMASLFVLYMPFYYTIATSLSVQSMIMVLKAGARLPLERLFDVFASRELLLGRLEAMQQNGYLLDSGNGFAATARAERIVSVFLVMRRMWKLGSGG